MIGFDRSAFAAGPPVWARQLKCESSSDAIHDEGLQELPIKNSNQTSVALSVVLITKMNLSKADQARASDAG